MTAMTRSHLDAAFLRQPVSRGNRFTARSQCHSLFAKTTFDDGSIAAEEQRQPADTPAVLVVLCNRLGRHIWTSLVAGHQMLRSNRRRDWPLVTQLFEQPAEFDFAHVMRLGSFPDAIARQVALNGVVIFEGKVASGHEHTLRVDHRYAIGTTVPKWRKVTR